MEKIEYIMIEWTYSPLYKSIVVITADGQEKKIQGGQKRDFLTTLNEYGNEGWKISDNLSFGDGGNFLIRSILYKVVDIK